jgi:hypothetical protein
MHIEKKKHILKMEVGSSEILVNIYQTMWRHILGASSHRSHRCGDFKSHNSIQCLVVSSNVTNFSEV